MFSLCFKLSDRWDSTKVDPFFGTFIWLLIWILAPVWIPIHVLLVISGRVGFLWKGKTVLAWDYWVIDFSSWKGFKKVDG